MKRNLFGILSLMALSLLLSTVGAHAQSAARADVPFAFTVGTAHLPAGTYKIRRAEFNFNIVEVSNLKTGTTVLATFQPDSPAQVTDKLVFHTAGDHYYLAEVRGGQGSLGMKLRTPKQKSSPEIASETAPSGKEVLIALK